MQLNNKMRGVSVILIFAIILVIALAAFVAVRHFSNQGQTTVSESTSSQTLYSCPMHPEVVSDKPDKCPKCGMNLEPKKT